MGSARQSRDTNRGKIGPMLEITHPEAEWYPFTAAVEGNEAYHGHEGLRRWWENVDARFDRVDATVDDIRDLGDQLLALGRFRARFRSGVTLDTEIAWLSDTGVASPSGATRTRTTLEGTATSGDISGLP